MPDTDRWLLPLAAAGICAAGMAVLAAGIGLALGTTGHDWYAAWKLTLVETMLTVGFDYYGVVDYRTAAGQIITVERYRFAYVMLEPWLARRKILFLAADRAAQGACAGLALFGMWLVARMALRLRELESGRGTVVEPAPRGRSGYAGRMHHPDDWRDGELIAALARRSGKVGVLLVSPAEIERLAGGGGHVAGQPAMARESPPPAQAPGLPPPENAAPADPGNREGKAEADKAPGNKAVGRRREPGEEFF